MSRGKNLLRKLFEVLSQELRNFPFSGDYLNDKPYYYDPVSKFYLYYYEQYGSWQMNYRPGTEMAWFYGYSDPAFPCPTGNDESWMEWKNDQWVPMEDFRIYAA